ncbi:MAG: glycine-rich domain-containing protein, partial [Candidatus Nanopelagicales bacterium]
MAAGLMSMPQVSAVVDPCASFSGVGYTATETSIGSGICQTSFAYSGTDPQTSYTWSVPTSVSAADVIVVGGGGGGGGGKAVPNGASPDNSELFAGNGGGGGSVSVGSVTFSTATVLVKVGKGGAGGAVTAAGSAGQASQFDALLASGGGAGDAVVTSNPGSTKGGGSGRTVSGTATSSANGGTALGTLFSASGKQSPGGGGAGAGQSPTGTNAFPLNAGGASYVAPWLNGGTRSVDATVVTEAGSGRYPGSGFGGNGYQPVLGLFSTNVTYYGGGGAGGNTNDSQNTGPGYGGGAGGGLYDAGAAKAFNGTASTGGGGGGGYAGRIFDGVEITYPVGAGGAGGSGVVIVRWALSSPSPSPTPTPAPTTPAPAPAPAQDSSPSASATPTPTPTPTATASTATVLGPVTNTANDGVPAGGVAPGTGVLIVNGEKVSVTVRPDARDDKLLEVSGPGFTMSLAGLNAKGEPLGLTPDGALILEQDRTAAVAGTGFQPNSLVYLYLFSEPRFLGTVQTDANGGFKGSVPLPADIADGRHTLQSNGFTPDGTVRSLSLGVVLATPVVATPKRATAKVYFESLSSVLTDEGMS